MRIRLNLASKPLENNRRFISGAGVLGVVGIVAFAFLSMHAYKSWRSNTSLRAEIAGYQTRIAALQKQQQELAEYFKAPQMRDDVDRADFLNSLIEQRSFPWTKVFMDLEQTLPPGVRIISIAPKMQKGHVEITLVVGALDDVGKLKFLKALEESKAFSGVQLMQESHSTQSTTADKVTIELMAWYATS